MGETAFQLSVPVNLPSFRFHPLNAGTNAGYGSSGAFMSRLCGKSRTLVASWQAGKSVPTASDIATIAARYGVSEAYLRGEVDFPESNLSALQRRLMDSTHDLTDDEMRKVIEYVRFVKFLRE